MLELEGLRSWSFGCGLFSSVQYIFEKSGHIRQKATVQHETNQTAYKKFNTYSIKQPDLYYFETIKMTSQAWSNFVWRIRAGGEYSL